MHLLVSSTEGFMQAQKEDIPWKPLIPAEKNNATAPEASGKPRVREVASRHKSGISSNPPATPSMPKRFPSPTVGQPTPTPGVMLSKRAVSAERRRPSSPTSKLSTPSSPSRPSSPSSSSSRSTTPVRDSVTEINGNSRRLRGSRAADGLWPSIRSLSSSFQSESVSVISTRDKPFRHPSPVGSVKSVPNSGSDRRMTPLRGRSVSEQSENSRPIESSPSRVIENRRWLGTIGGGLSSNSISKSVDLTDRIKKSASLPVPSRGVSPKRAPVTESESVTCVHHPDYSVIGRVLSDGSSRKNEHNMGQVVNGHSNPLERSALVTRKARSPSPVPSLHRASSPSKMISISTSNSGAVRSPMQTWPLTPSNSSITATSRAGVPVALNFGLDLQTGKKQGNSQIQDAHLLRLLHNRNLQWCFVNALSDALPVIQKIKAERALMDVCVATSELRDSVILKRMKLQRLKQEMKLNSVLEEQMAYLEEWSSVETNLSCSLFGAADALKASTLRLPVTSGARVDVRALRNAVSSAIDTMHAMGSSLHYHLLSKAEGINNLALELSNVAAEDVGMLVECRDLLALTGALQAQEASLKSHLMQLRPDSGY